MATLYIMIEIYSAIKLNLKYQSHPKLLSYIKLLTQRWQICQNEVEDEKLYCYSSKPKEIF